MDDVHRSNAPVWRVHVVVYGVGRNRMSIQFQVNVLYVNGKYYLYILRSMDDEFYTDIKECSLGETE